MQMDVRYSITIRQHQSLRNCQGRRENVTVQTWWVNWPKAGCQNAGTGGGGYVISGSGYLVDLTTASRDVLIAIIAQLQATVLEQQRVIERLERRVAELEGQAKPGGPPRMPGLKRPPGSRQRSSSLESSDATASPAGA